ncbi:class 1 fructose-bisphosphatase [Alkanindiges sp. WGS2144]|uniref:class 1 fructose-bisphosphatase n=1 Tax=Alkanindiges sp. WGS2144 TaxID=3366808 RepID=UPI003752BB73
MSNISLNQYLLDRQQSITHLTSDLTQLLLQVSIACKAINAALQKGALANMLGSAGSDNVQGEVQKKLDVVSNTILIDTVLSSGKVAALASEEMDDMISGHDDAKYLLLFDPLDGSSNIDINMSVGTIFSILEKPHAQPAMLEDFMQEGHKQIAAGYVLYGPSTMLVLTLGDGVDAFTLDQEIGEFILTAERLSIPEDTQEFAINSSNSRHWEAPVKRYIDECLAGKTGVRGKDFNMRWVACMVGDIHRILIRGGIFMYPYDLKDPKKAGRLRLMYEANPMGMLVEQAGGTASTGRQSILEVKPTDLHQRIPVILGSKNEVERVKSYHQST